jgi:hypothetical protein
MAGDFYQSPPQATDRVLLFESARFTTNIYHLPPRATRDFLVEGMDIRVRLRENQLTPVSNGWLRDMSRVVLHRPNGLLPVQM